MIQPNILRLVMGVLMSGAVLGQQPQGTLLSHQLGPTPQQQRPLQPQRPLSALQPRPSAQNLLRDQQQAFGALSQQRADVRANRFTAEQVQGPLVPIVEDIRDGPFHDGSYYFGFVSGDGSVREEGAVPTADGSVIVTGSYTYTAPNGEVIDMQYIADANGYRAFPKGSRPEYSPPQRVLNAPPLPNTPFVDEGRPDLIRPLLNQRPQSFRPVSNNLNNQVNRQFNRPGGAVARTALGANRIIGNNQAAASSPNLAVLSSGLPGSEGSFSTKVNVIAEPIQENNI